MEGSQIITSVLCFLVGITLGLFGGGGSVLTVPIFIYVSRYSVNEAISLSLLTVGGASLMGSIRYLFKGLVNGRLVGIFFIAGSFSAFLGAHFTALFSAQILMILFGGLMTVIAAALYLNSASADQSDQPAVCRPGFAISFSLGLLTGFLTGFLGVGGGFLIVPTIALLMRCSLQTAIGTSLVIITLNSFIGYAGHMRAESMSVMPGALFVLATVAGTFTGIRLGVRVKSSVLQRGFAAMIFFAGLFLIAVNIKV